MLGLTPLGVFHTAIGLVALVYAVIALKQDKLISLDSRAGLIYLWATLITTLTSFGIFQHGGFGKPHALAVMTMAALIVGTVAAKSTLFGRASRYVQAVSYTSTVLFHLIAGSTETLTRLPAGDPIAASPEAPIFQPIYGTLVVLLVIALFLQIRWLRARP
jgi:uncharacterized membrane protein